MGSPGYSSSHYNNKSVHLQDSIHPFVWYTVDIVSTLLPCQICIPLVPTRDRKWCNETRVNIYIQNSVKDFYFNHKLFNTGGIRYSSSSGRERKPRSHTTPLRNEYLADQPNPPHLIRKIMIRAQSSRNNGNNSMRLQYRSTIV